MATTEERLETVEKKLEEKTDPGRAILRGCGAIGLAILLNGCLTGRGGPFSSETMRGSAAMPLHVELSINSNDRLKVRLVDAAGKDISLE